MKKIRSLGRFVLLALLLGALAGCLPEPPDPLGKKLWQAVQGGGQGAAPPAGGGYGSPGGYPASQPVQGNTGSRCTPAQASAVVAEHNRARAEVGVGALQWSNELASMAQRWADHLAQTGGFEHSGNRGVGENLAWSSARGMDPVQGVRMWYEEKRDYRGGAIRGGGGGPMTGHYTQMVWRGTTAVGCGVATGANGTVVVCNYSPPGNFVGQRPY